MREFDLIEEGKEDEYIYELLMILEKIISIMSVMAFAIYMDKINATLVFLIFLLTIKSRSGGYHMNTFFSCFISTLLLYFLFVMYLVPVMLHNQSISYICLLLAVIVIWKIGAINHPNMNWNKDEVLESKKKTRQILAIELMIIGGLQCCNIWNEIMIAMIFAIVVCANLMLLAKIKKQEVVK